MIFVSVFVLASLIFVHELGHFLFAKYFKVGVVEFAIGFGPTIISKKVGESFYSLRAIPLGGYVRMVGETMHQLQDDIPKEEVDPTKVTAIEKHAEVLKQDRSNWFILKSLWARFLIVFAGPLFNIIFALLASFASVYIYGVYKPVDQPIVGDLMKDYPAEKAGIKIGDKILKVNNTTIVEWKQISEIVASAKAGDNVEFDIERKDGDKQTLMHLVMSPKLIDPEFAAIEGVSDKKFRIGIVQDIEKIPATFSTAVRSSGYHVLGVSLMTVRGLYGMISAKISPKHISGPIYIFKEAANSARQGAETLLDFMVMLSISLAILNLLPIPVLDGGHIFFFALEAIFRKPVALKYQRYAMQVGVFLLLSLMCVALFNDVGRLIM